MIEIDDILSQYQLPERYWSYPAQEAFSNLDKYAIVHLIAKYRNDYALLGERIMSLLESYIEDAIAEVEPDDLFRQDCVDRARDMGAI